MRFRTKTEWFLWAAVGFVFLIYLGVGFLMYLPNGDVSAFYGLAIIWLFLALFLLWILPKTTHYTFLDDHLLCQSVGIKKRIVGGFR
jgi:membrane protein YdbS with pleckstrin-like domain